MKITIAWLHLQAFQVDAIRVPFTGAYMIHSIIELISRFQLYYAKYVAEARWKTCDTSHLLI